VSGIPVVTTPAAIDISNVDELRVALLSATAAGYATIVADMSATGFCDSAAFRELERAHQRAVAEGGEIRLVISNAQLLRPFEVTGSRIPMRTFPALAAALADVPPLAIQPPGPATSTGFASVHMRTA